MIGSFDINIAKNIWRNEIAAKRNELFQKNDLAIRDAQIANDAAALEAAVLRRDALRALGDKIDSATTIDELKTIIPV